MTISSNPLFIESVLRMRAICHCAVDYVFDNPLKGVIYAIGIATILMSPYSMILVAYGVYRLYKVLDMSNEEARVYLKFALFFSRTDSSNAPEPAAPAA